MNSNDASTKIQRALDSLVEDVLSRTDEELAAEADASGDSFDELAARAEAAINGAILAAGRLRLANARRKLTQHRATSTKTVALDAQRARMIFNHVRSRERGLTQTLAARGGTEPNETQILEIVQDWIALGVVTEDDLDK